MYTQYTSSSPSGNFPIPLRDGFLAHMLSESIVDLYISRLLSGASVSTLQPIIYGNKMLIRSPSPSAGSSNYHHFSPGAVGGDAWIIDYIADRSLGEVVRQRLGIPSSEENIARHFTNANLLAPIFFESADGSLGIPLLLASGGATSDLRDENRPAMLGGKSTTHLCLNWVGYVEYKKQVEIQDSHRRPITMGRLARRVGSFVDSFFDASDDYFHASDPDWAIHGRAWRIKREWKECTRVIGIIHVSQGVWQPILQLRGVWPLHDSA